jgi:hypothetical protein
LPKQGKPLDLELAMSTDSVHLSQEDFLQSSMVAAGALAVNLEGKDITT